MKWTVKDIPPLFGKVAVVTGANSGIGWHTALELAHAGCEVILTTRSDEKGRDAAERIRKALPQVKVHAEVLDLASLKSVRAFAARMQTQPWLDMLINNAGVMAVPRRELTEDGFERQLGTNFLGHFALTGLLMPVLRRARAPRVTTVSSVAANFRMRRINFDDLMGERSYNAWTAYCQSKLADLMFALELARRCAAKKIPVVSDAAHPGYARTNLQTSGPGRPQGRATLMIEGFASQHADAGALPTLRAATELNAAPGSYYGPHRFFHLKGYPVRVSIPGPARNEKAAKRLWETAEKLTGVRFEI